MVKQWFETSEPACQDFRATHREVLGGSDGEYEIDVVVRFSALGGAEFTVLCECKKHNHPIKRELVQVLHSKLQSVGAHKAILVATSPFQSGAIEFAETHGIALVTVENGSVAYIQMSAVKQPFPIPADADTFVGVLASQLNPNWIGPILLSTRTTYYLDQFLKE